MRPGQHHLSFVVSCGGAALRPRGQLPPVSALLPCSQSSRRSGLKPMTGNSTRPAVLPVSPSSASLPRQTQPAVPTVNSPPPQRQRRPTSQYNKSFVLASQKGASREFGQKGASRQFSPSIDQHALSRNLSLSSQHAPNSVIGNASIVILL